MRTEQTTVVTTTEIVDIRPGADTVHIKIHQGEKWANVTIEYVGGTDLDPPPTINRLWSTKVAP